MKKNKVRVALPVGSVKCACGLTVTYTRLAEHLKTCEAQEPETRKAAQALGAKGGSKKTPKKAAAARKNGKLGGRPKKKR